MCASLAFQGHAYAAGDFIGWRQRLSFARWREQLAGTTQLDIEDPATLAARIQGDLRMELASLSSQGFHDVAEAIVHELTGADAQVSREVARLTAGGPEPGGGDA